MDPTGENPKKNWDNGEEEDELFQDLTQEFDCKEERDPLIHKKLEKILQDLLRGVFRKEKVEKVVMDTLSPQNLKK